MKELLEHIIKSIVNTSEDVVITERESVDFPGLVILAIKVAPSDTGIVIGKRGRTINAIRDIIAICAIRNKKRVRVILEEENGGREADTATAVETPSKEDQKVEEKAEDSKTEEDNFNTKDSSDDILSDDV